jgi:hypothetical protein
MLRSGYVVVEIVIKYGYVLVRDGVGHEYRGHRAARAERVQNPVADRECV